WVDCPTGHAPTSRARNGPTPPATPFTPASTRTSTSPPTTRPPGADRSTPPAGLCRWARHRARHGDRRRTRRSPRWAVELRLGEIRRRLAQDLVRSLELTVLLLQPLDPLRVLGRGPGLMTVVDVGLLHPAAHRLHAVAELIRDPLDRPV